LGKLRVKSLHFGEHIQKSINSKNSKSEKKIHCKSAKGTGYRLKQHQKHPNKPKSQAQTLSPSVPARWKHCSILIILRIQSVPSLILRLIVLNDRRPRIVPNRQHLLVPGVKVDGADLSGVKSIALLHLGAETLEKGIDELLISR
jgi:hypothetical protein